MIVNGALVTSPGSELGGYRVSATWPDPAGGTARATALTEADGTFAVPVPDAAERGGPPGFGVADRSGREVARAEPAEADLASSLSISVPAPAAPPDVAVADDPALGRAVRYSGRILTRSGTGVPAGLLVVLWGVLPGTDASAAVPLDVATTTSGGYVFGPWPTHTLDRAFVRLAGGDPIEVDLVGGRLPTGFAIVTDTLPAAPAEEPDHDDCACGSETPRAPEAAELARAAEAFAADAGGCVGFTVPNRVLEEVTFQAVVRTTQPELRGTPPPLGTDPVPAPLVQRLVDLARQHPDAPSRTGGFPALGPPARLSATIGRPLSAMVGDKALASKAIERARRLLGGLDPDADLTDVDGPTAVAAAVVAARDGTTPVRLEPSVLAELHRERSSLTPLRLLSAELSSAVRRFRSQAVQVLGAPPARFVLDEDRQVEWDDLPLAHQATTIAHGHLITFKQVWKADGYSLGDLLYSLPLAPGQQKIVSVLDWERREEATRSAAWRTTEQLATDATRDRDITDVVRSALSEHQRGESSADVAAVGGGLGGFIAPVLFGAAGGVSSASSTASQVSGRAVSGSALNKVRDRTLQAASAVRAQRTSVVQAARQGESVRAETEVVVNHNHCHAMTVEYFEVLRHLQVRQEVHQVQECLLVPLALTRFNNSKILRWRSALEPSIRTAALRGAFAATERVSTGWADADTPAGRHADEPVEHLDGELLLRISLPRPADTDDHGFDAEAWSVYRPWLWDSPQNIWSRYQEFVPRSRRDRAWDSAIAPGIASRLVNALTLTLLRTDGGVQPLSVDPTLVSTFRQDRPLLVGLRVEPGELGTTTRADIAGVRLALPISTPPTARIVLETATFRYRTAYLTADLVSRRRTLNDIGAADNAEMATPLTRQERSNPRENDRRASRDLREHLDEHLEHYHRAIWLRMDPNRRYLLLDGVLAPDAGGRSVASVVENRVVGVVGNCLVLPLRPGAQLDPTYAFGAKGADELRHLYADGSAPPMRISLPTRGVFAEAVLGSCNSCEVIDDTKFWRFEEEPIPDSPTSIGGLSTTSRRRAVPNLDPDRFPDGLARLPGLPDATDPTGLAAAMKTLGTAGLFRGITGLALNQANSAQGLKLTLSTAQTFATQAGTLARQRFLSRDLDRSLARVKDARDRKHITPDQARGLAEELFRGAIGAPAADQPPAPTATSGVQKVMQRAATASGGGSVTITRPSGSVEVRTGSEAASGGLDVALDPPLGLLTQKSATVCWAAAGTMMANWQNRRADTVEAVLDAVGGPWRGLYDGGTGDQGEALDGPQLRAFAAALGLTEEGPASYPPSSIARLLGDRGPLWVVSDDNFGTGNQLVHTRVVVAMRGDGSAEHTTVTLADPATGSLVREGFTAFAQQLEADEAADFGLGIFHF